MGLRILAIFLALAFAFMVAVDVAVLTSDGSIKWGIFILYLIGTALLGYLAVFCWRRGGARKAGAGAPPAV